MRFFIVILVFLGLAYWLISGMSEHAFFAALTDMFTPYLSQIEINEVIHYGIAVVIFCFGLVLAWPTRPGFLRRHPIKIFLEKDSGSDLYGVHTFPGISYIQPSVTTSISIENCRAWITRVEYSEDSISPYSVIHNERHPLPWSKHVGPNPKEAVISSADPPVRVNVAVFDGNSFQLDPTVQTPTNLLPKLQNVGFYRFTILLTGVRKTKIGPIDFTNHLSETKKLIVRRTGAKKEVAVSLDD